MTGWFGTILDHLQDEILLLDPDTLHYLHGNRAALDHLGCTLDEVRALTPMDVTRGADGAVFRGYVQRLRQGEPFVSFEGVRAGPVGEAYPVEARWQLLATEAGTVVLAVACDISDRRRIETMKDEFLSVVNHELRTPLTSIHGALRLLQQGLGGELPPQAAHLVELAVQNSDRLRQVVDGIVDLEKIASGTAVVEVEPLLAREALERVAAAYMPPAEVAGVVIRVDADPALRLLADARRLQQVLANLVSNAVRYAPPDSVVLLSASQRAEDAHRVLLEVVDRGPGVPEAFRPRIFERFAQADMSTHRASGGSGLGLAIARNLAHRMGGRIGFDSRPGRTRFWVDLPAQEGT